MTCKRCDLFWAQLSEESDSWERAHSNESELWSQESDKNLELIEQAFALRKTDPAGAFELYLEAAETGSVWSMETVGWHYRRGIGVAANLDKALEYYRRAICAGSWMATIQHATLLAELGLYDDCERVLEDGVASDFVPAYFWLAWLRYERSKTREICEEARLLMEYAAKRGHPEAKIRLAQWMLFGKLGYRKIFSGIILAVQSAVERSRQMPGEQELSTTVGQANARK